MSSAEEVLQAVRDAMAAQDYEKAELELRMAAKRWKKDPEFAVRHANVLVKLGQHGPALKIYRKVMAKAPERLDACSSAASCAIQLGKGKLAEKLYSRAIGLGMSLDRATLGISRSLVLRSRHLEAWNKAVSQFKSSGNKSKELHDLLKEISPQTGISVPHLDMYDSAVLDVELEGVRRNTPDPRLEDNSFAAGSIEAMAGIDRTTLVEEIELSGDTILGSPSLGKGSTSLGIDLSSISSLVSESNDDDTILAESRIETDGGIDLDLDDDSYQNSLENNSIDNSDTPSVESNEESASPDKVNDSTNSDDPFDDWPEF